MRQYYHIIYRFIIMMVILLGSLNIYGNSKVMVQGVPVINQYPELPTGCEATALTMLLQYYGVDTTKEEVAIAMPKAPVPTYYNGKKYGENPNNAFIGDPFKTNSYGVYSPVVLKMINTYLPGRAEDLGGENFDKIYKAIDDGRPVMIWTTIGMLQPEVGDRWTAPRGEVVEWMVPEHAVVMVGYDKDDIYINDPYTGTLKKYPKQVVINRWVSMGRQAVAIKTRDIYSPNGTVSRSNVIIDGITYKNLVRVDTQGEWIAAGALQDIHQNTKVSYNGETGSIHLEVREERRMPSVVSKWISKNTSNKLEAVPMNLNGKYYINIELLPEEKEIITYNSKGKRIDMAYKIVDSVTYVSLDWVRNFYNMKIMKVQ